MLKTIAETLQAILQVLRSIYIELKQQQAKPSKKAAEEKPEGPTLFPIRKKALKSTGTVGDTALFLRAGITRKSKYCGEKVKMLRIAVKRVGCELLSAKSKAHYCVEADKADAVVAELKKLA